MTNTAWCSCVTIGMCDVLSANLFKWGSSGPQSNRITGDSKACPTVTCCCGAINYTLHTQILPDADKCRVHALKRYLNHTTYQEDLFCLQRSVTSTSSLLKWPLVTRQNVFHIQTSINLADVKFWNGLPFPKCITWK